MLSIIVCSRNKSLSDSFVRNVDVTIGVDYELVCIDNSASDHSIFSAYNEGFARSKHPYLCFVHEDVLFHSHGWGEKIIAHLQVPTVGIIGLAGGDLATRVPGSCAGKDSSVNIVQSDRTGKKKSVTFRYPQNYSQSRRSTIILDGVLLCMKRELLEKIRFDDQLGGFHGYDFDISIQSTLAGYTNYVIYDIELEHLSRGQFDAVFYQNQIKVFRKWEKYLPLMGESITSEDRATILDIELVKLRKLVKKMIRNGFSLNEIKTQASYYSRLIGTEAARKFGKNIDFHLCCTRLSESLRKVFK